MQSNKYEKARKASETGKYPQSFYTCMFMIPKSVQDKLNYLELAEMVDVIQKSYENGHAACYREMKD